jgi:hypothetical protein
MLKENTIKQIIDYINVKPYFEAEDVSEKLNISIEDVKRAIQQIKIIQGWSIVIENNRPYERGFRRIEKANPNPISNRGRERVKSTSMILMRGIGRELDMLF